jgi:tryptophan halogenase
MSEPRPSPIRRVVVVGGGFTGWTAAARLARGLGGDGAEIHLVEGPEVDEDLPGLGAVESSLPSIHELHGALGLSDEILVRRAGVGFKLGVRFDGFAGAETSHFASFGETGAPLGAVAFHQVLARLNRAGFTRSLEDFALAAAAAALGRFARPAADRRSVLSTLDYAMHLDLRGYTAVLKEVALKAGVRQVGGGFGHIERAEDGAVQAITLTDGARLEAELWLDCTGPAAKLIGALDDGFEDWSAFTPFDRAAAIEAPAVAFEPFTRIEATPVGWLRQIPAQGRRSMSLVWSSAHATEEAALQIVGAGAAISRMRPGRRRAWVHNCVAVGASAGFVEPLASARMRLAQDDVARLLSLFPVDRDCRIEAREYDRLNAQALERLRDFTLAHYVLNRRTGEPLWDDLRTRPLPESLAYKLRLFESRGRVALYDGEVFEERDWVQALLGLGVAPLRYDALADTLPLADTQALLERMRRTIREAAEAMPSHGDFVAQCVSAA